MGRRSNIDIMAEILQLGKSDVGKTRIMYSVNMSHSQMEKYIKLLVRGEFLQPIEINSCSRGSLKYRTTAKGKLLLRDIDRMCLVLGTDGYRPDTDMLAEPEEEPDVGGNEA